MKLYLIYARFPKMEIDRAYSHINTDDYKVINGFYVGLYAHTTNKKFAKEFMKSRKASNFFFLKKIDDDKEKIKNFTNSFANSKKELVLRTFKASVTDEIYTSILCTIDEHTETIYNDGAIEDVLIQTLSDSIDPKSDYYPLKNEYIKALDIIGYTSIYDLSCGGHPNFDDDWVDVRVDVVGNNISYGLSAFGFVTFGKFSEKLSEVTKFIILYRRMFLKGD